MKLKLGLCQMKVTADKAENLRHARELIDKAAAGGAEMVMLPEMFNCPYEGAAFPVYAEPAGGESWQMLSRAAKENGVYLVGGSVPELEDGKIYNTSFLFDREGRELARHRKVLAIQPFGCLPGHVCGRGQYAALMRRLGKGRLVTADTDASGARALFYDRVKLLTDIDD